MCLDLPRQPAPKPQRATCRDCIALVALAFIPAVIALAIVAFFAIAIGGQIR